MFTQLDSRRPQMLKAVQATSSASADQRRRHIDEHPQIAAERHRDGRGGRGPADQDDGADAEGQPIGLGPGAPDIDVFRAGLPETTSPSPRRRSAVSSATPALTTKLSHRLCCASPAAVPITE